MYCLLVQECLDNINTKNIRNVKRRNRWDAWRTGGDGSHMGVTTRLLPRRCSPCLLQLRQLSTRQQMQQGQNWDKMVSYHPRKIERDIFSVLSFTAPHNRVSANGLISSFFLFYFKSLHWSYNWWTWPLLPVSQEIKLCKIWGPLTQILFLLDMVINQNFVGCKYPPFGAPSNQNLLKILDELTENYQSISIIECAAMI